MYGLVPFNISPIQQGIQFGHAVVEYGLNFFNDPQYQDWANNWKTFIILNGGKSNHSTNRYQSGEFWGSMEKNCQELVNHNVKIAEFYEPDLNDLLSAIVFIVDERVFNKVKYPDFEDWIIENYDNLIKDTPYTTDGTFRMAKSIKESDSEEDQKIYQSWIHSIGGYQNLFLREFLKNFRLA